MSTIANTSCTNTTTEPLPYNAEEVLRRTNESLSFAQRAANAGVWDWDLASDKVYVSPEYRDLYGMGPDTPLTYDFWLNHIVHPEDRERVDEYGREFFKAGSEYRIDFRIVHPAGGERWIAGRGTLTRNAAGKPLRFTGINLDITDRKIAEAAVQAANRHKDEFLAMLGHELRNPLGIITTALELMRFRDVTGTLHELRDMIDGQVQHMRRLIDDLLDVSRITTGKIHLEKECCELSDVLTKTLTAYHEGLKAGGLSVDVELPRQPIFFTGDQTRIEQVIGNLLHNATKFTDSGGKVTLSLCATRDGTSAVITVRDTGIGIDAAILPRIFETFTQADGAVDRSRGGLGLGLALVRGLVELHGGEVKAESEGIGKGSVFTLRLPLDPPKISCASQESEYLPDVRPIKIVIIDDNFMAARSAQMLLNQLGHRAETAHNGTQGIALVEQIRPEVVLCDLGLPGIDGYEVARRLRHHAELSNIHLFSISGYGQEEDKRRALEAGFDAHLVKPIDFRELQRLLAEFISDPTLQGRP
jgi:PAS domain S-box-containing protein